MKRKSIIEKAFILSLMVIIPIALIFLSRKISSKNIPNQFAEVIEGDFTISVSAVGELSAENSIEIKGPVISVSGRRRGHTRGIRAVGIKILDIVPEGTEVKGETI